MNQIGFQAVSSVANPNALLVEILLRSSIFFRTTMERKRLLIAFHVFMEES